MGYKIKLEDGTTNYFLAMKKVKGTPAPEGQKFPIGSFVKIAKDLGLGMDHFESDTFAKVLHTYAHAYGGDDVKSYCLSVRNKHFYISITDESEFSVAPHSWYRCAWYYEDQLEPVIDGVLIKKLEKELTENKRGI